MIASWNQQQEPARNISPVWLAYSHVSIKKHCWISQFFSIPGEYDLERDPTRYAL